MKKILLGFGAIILAVVAIGFLSGGENNNVGVVPMAKAHEAVVYREATCGCCGAYISYLKKEGFIVSDNVVDSIDPIKEQYNVPMDMQSCHTTIIDGYVVEGDNADLSRDSRDWDQAIHPSRTSGVVSWCWSPKRAWRARTPEGRLLNYLQFRYLPKMYVVAEGGRAVIRETDGFFLVSPDSRTPLELPDLHWGSAAGAVAWSPEGDHVAVLYSNGVAVFGRDGQLLWSLPLELAEWNTIRWTAKRIEIVLADSPLGYAIDPLTKRVEGLNIMAP